jgi:hypothetical protein
MRSKILQAVLIAATVFGVAAPAFADRDDYRDHQRREWRAHEWREHHRGYVYRPGYVYAPPPVVYAPPPPPPIAEPTLSFVIPLNFR